MIYLLTFVLALPSGLIWLVNGEALVVLQVSQPDVVPWVVALAVTLGQFVGYACLFFGASTWLARVPTVARAVRRFELREAGPASYAAFATGGLVGIPPLLALFAVYGSADVERPRTLFLIALPTRFCWYLTWAYAGGFMVEHLGGCFGAGGS